MSNPGLAFFDAGTTANDGTGTQGRSVGLQLNTQLLTLLAHAGTVNAGWFAYNSATGVSLGRTAVQIIQAAINFAVANGYTAVWIPTSVAGTTLLPYDASQVTFNPAVHMMREGGSQQLDEFDVKAYGATGDGIHDDTLSFQAAITASTVTPGGVVFVPGTLVGSGGNKSSYFITSGLTSAANTNLRMIGYLTNILPASGIESPVILGNFNGTLLTITGGESGTGAGGMVLQGISFRQLSTGTSAACVNASGIDVPAVIRDCHFRSGFHGLLLTGNTYVIGVENCNFEGVGTVGGYGCYAQGHTSLRSCNFIQWDKGFVHGAGGGSSFVGGRCEVNRTGIELGTDLTTGTRVLVTGITVSGVSFEANDTAMYVRQIQDSLLGGLHITGSVNSPSTTAIYGLHIDVLQSTLVAGVGIATIGGISWITGGVFFENNPTSSAFVAVRSTSTNGWGNTPNQPGCRLINCMIGEPSPAITGATPDTQMSTAGAATVYRISQGGATTVTNFLNGLVGCPLVLRAADGNTTIQHGTNIFLKTGADHLMATGETIQLMQFGQVAGRWDQI